MDKCILPSPFLCSVWLFRVICSPSALSWWRVRKRRWISMDISTRSVALTWVFLSVGSLVASRFEPWLSVWSKLLILSPSFFCVCVFLSGASGQFSFHSTQRLELWLICASSSCRPKQPWKCWKHIAAWFKHSSVLMKSKCRRSEFTLQAHKSSRPVQLLFSTADIL